MSNPTEWTEKHYSFLTSHLIAHRLFGYLFVNSLIKEPKNVEAESAYLCEFAGLIREVTSNIGMNNQLDYEGKYGFDGIVSAIEYDLHHRGKEWEWKEIAQEVARMLRESGHKI